MRPVLRALTGAVRSRRVALDHVVVVMMDEYLQPVGSAWRCIDDRLTYSCRRFALDEVLQPLNAAAAEPISEANVWLPDPDNPAEYDRRIDECGGVNIFLVAVGASDGHVAFNPPGTSRTSGTRVVELAESTRRDNLATFPDLPDLEAVPTHGVSVGLGTIARSQKVITVIHGASKRQAFTRLTATDGFDPDFPATIVNTVPDAEIWADQAAVGAGTNPLDVRQSSEARLT